MLKEEEHQKKLQKLKGKTQATWGRQIRSYVFDPYQLVKDHRTGTQEKKIREVLDGNLEKFALAFLRWKNKLRKAK